MQGKMAMTFAAVQMARSQHRLAISAGRRIGAPEKHVRSPEEKQKDLDSWIFSFRAATLVCGAIAAALLANDDTFHGFMVFANAGIGVLALNFLLSNKSTSIAPSQYKSHKCRISMAYLMIVFMVRIDKATSGFWQFRVLLKSSSTLRLYICIIHCEDM
ncbi:hypothetical protein PMAYCL1PPCAC_09955, partial [Pristionchus mayeri]